MGSQNIPLCDPYVWEDPRYLFRSIWNRPGCASEITNQVLFVYIAAILTGIVISSFAKIPSAPILCGLGATVYLIPSFMKLQTVESFRTQFEGSEHVHEDDDDPDTLLASVQKDGEIEPEGVVEGFVQSRPVFNDTGVAGVQSFSARNPFDNVLVNEIQYSPTRGAAANITTTKAKIAMDDFFRVQWYSDPTDVFGKSQSQREFITMPSTTIPNDQDSYQKWLYKIPGKTCKEGNAEACYGGTNGAALPWLNL